MNKWLTFTALLLTLTMATTYADPVPKVDDLQKSAREAKAQNEFLLVLVALSHCPYCDLLKEEILEPLLLSGEDEGKFTLVQIHIDEGEFIKDISGEEIAASDWASMHSAYVVPTLLFLSPEGKMLTPKLTGVNTVELFNFYLNESIQKARVNYSTNG